MKIAIIGCGNMGGAIARGLAADTVFASEHTIAVSNRTQPKLDAIKAEYPQIETSTDNCQAAAAADMGSTSLLFPVAWLGSTITGRWESS